MDGSASTALGRSPSPTTAGPANAFRITRRPSLPGDNYTAGTLLAPGLLLYTLELPWKNNEPRESCIPSGDYRCVLAWSNRYQRLMPRLLNVPGREGILLHPGNQTKDTSGCILVGTLTSGEGRLFDSQKAFLQFFDWMSQAMRTGSASCHIGWQDPENPLAETFPGVNVRG